ncbi:MAG: nitroreductase [Myxococcales bacterium]|nr:nitroreductase [Myxococcales bacterium]
MNNTSHPALEAQSLIDLISSRRTVHMYQNRSIDSDIIEQAVHAAHQAPNHKLTWPWRFTLIGPETKAKINDLAMKMKATNGPLEGTQLELFNQKRVHPQLMVVSQMISTDPRQSKEDYAAVSCAIQNFSLALAAHGIGSKWSTGSMTRHQLAYELSDIDQALEDIVGFIWFGYPERIPSPRRPDLSEIYRSTP